jgi:hypothetical protein
MDKNQGYLAAAHKPLRPNHQRLDMTNQRVQVATIVEEEGAWPPKCIVEDDMQETVCNKRAQTL